MPIMKMDFKISLNQGAPPMHLSCCHGNQNMELNLSEQCAPHICLSSIDKAQHMQIWRGVDNYVKGYRTVNFWMLLVEFY